MYNFVYCKNSYLNILGEICGFFLCTFLPSMKTKRLEIKGEEWVPGFFRQLTVCLVGFQAVLNMSSTPWRCWGLHVHCTVYCNKIRFNEWYFIYIKSQFLHHPSSFQTNKQKIDVYNKQLDNKVVIEWKKKRISNSSGYDLNSPIVAGARSS